MEKGNQMRQGDMLVVTVECGMCGKEMVEDLTDFATTNKIPIVERQDVTPELMSEFLRRRGADLVPLSLDLIAVRCPQCQKWEVKNPKHMMKLPVTEYQRLLEIEKRYEEANKDQRNPEGGW